MNKKEIENLSMQLANLMDQADLTNEGLSEGAGLTTMTIRRLLDKSTNPSDNTVNKLKIFFGISTDQLFSNKTVRLNKASHQSPLNVFTLGNKSNPIYFSSRKKEQIASEFIRTVLLHDDFLTIGRRASAISYYLKENDLYRRDISAKLIAKIFERLYRDGLVNREDRTGKKSVYYYAKIK